MLVAAEPSLVEGLLLLSYPLHPPGRPAQLRTAHFPSLRVPTLFVSGTKDTFGSIEELEGAIKLIPARQETGGNRRRAARPVAEVEEHDEVPDIVVREFEAFFPSS